MIKVVLLGEGNVGGEIRLLLLPYLHTHNNNNKQVHQTVCKRYTSETLVRDMINTYQLQRFETCEILHSVSSYPHIPLILHHYSQTNDTSRLQTNDTSRLQTNDTSRLQTNDTSRLQTNDTSRLVRTRGVRSHIIKCLVIIIAFHTGMIISSAQWAEDA